MGKRVVLAHVILAVIAALFQGCIKEPEKTQMFTIGLVTNSWNGMRNLEGFKTGMTNRGYLEGEKIRYISADSPLTGQAIYAYMDMLVEQKVDMVFTAGTLTGIAAFEQAGNAEIPIIFGVIADPVAAGVMTDLTEPGGNMTGVMLSQNQSRRLDLLIEIDPEIKSLYLPYNPDDPAPVSARDQITPLARRLGISVVEGHARNRDEALALLESIPDGIDAIFLLPDSTVNPHLAKIVALANQRKIPISGPSMIQVENGALTSYGIIHTDVGMQAAYIAEQVLSGADPGTLPVEIAEFVLGINLQTAETIGLEVPSHIIQQARFIVRSGGND